MNKINNNTYCIYGYSDLVRDNRDLEAKQKAERDSEDSKIRIEAITPTPILQIMIQHLETGEKDGLTKIWEEENVQETLTAFSVTGPNSVLYSNIVDSLKTLSKETPSLEEKRRAVEIVNKNSKIALIERCRFKRINAIK